MTTLGELISADDKKSLAKSTIQIGDVYRMKMDRANGITPPVGTVSRNKFFVVLGFDGKGNIFGGVIINSKVNPNMNQNIRDWHMPIKVSDYPFLAHDSYIDCSTLKTADARKFETWQYKGKIEEYDLELVIGAVKSSPSEDPKKCALFGL